VGRPELYLVSLDAASGRIIAHRAWPAPEATLNNVYVGANRDSNFLLLQHNALCLYSPELQEIKKVEVPADPGAGHSGFRPAVNQVSSATIPEVGRAWKC
jgi:hypothetical protein